jgi:hypothetical protein
MKKEEESTKLKAHKMMMGKVEPSIVPIVVRAMPPMIEVIKHIATIP